MTEPQLCPRCGETMITRRQCVEDDLWEIVTVCHVCNSIHEWYRVSAAVTGKGLQLTTSRFEASELLEKSEEYKTGWHDLMAWLAEWYELDLPFDDWGDVAKMKEALRGWMRKQGLMPSESRMVGSPLIDG